MARLPLPGGDAGNWGTILNDYLGQTLNPDGTLKNGSVTGAALSSDAVTTSSLADSSVNTAQVADNAITEVKLDAAVQTKLNQTASVADGSIAKVKLSTGVQSSLDKADAAPTALSALSDTSGVASATSNQVLSYDSGTNKWVPSTISNSTVSDATTSAKGIVQLAGDLSGTSAAPTVVKINGVSVTGIPSANQVLSASSTNAATWVTPTVGAVSSVNTRTGAITLTKSDVGLGNVDNTADSAKPVSSETQAALDLRPLTTDLSTVAFSGDYADLLNIPTVADGILLAARGINAAGGEFAHNASTLPGTYGTDYSYDSAQSFTFLASKGHKIIRLPFRWERIQPTRGAALNTTELNRLLTVVSNIQAAGMQAILDVHNYARYINSSNNGGAELVLGSDLPVSDLTDLWVRLSDAFKSNSGIYAYDIMNEPHDLAASASNFTGTTRYDWNDGTTQGWTGDSATASNAGSALRLSSTVSGSGFYFFRKDDTGIKRGGVLTGNYLQAIVTLQSGVSGTWSAKLEWQNSSYQYQTASSTTYVRVDNNQVVSNLIPGVAIKVLCNFSSNPITSPNAFAIQIESNNAIGGSNVYVDIDDFAQGTASNGKTGAQNWEDYSQQVVTAIRNNNDATKIYVPGYSYSGAQTWTIHHPSPWINDPLNNFAYQAHYYFDSNNSGTYANSFTTENTNAINSGYDSLADRAVSQLSTFINWLNTNGVKGYLGEFGWPNTGDTTGWNSVGNSLYNILDQHNIEATYWATGARWGSSYALSAYTGEPLSSSSTQASTIEAHPSVYSASQVLASNNAPGSATSAGSAGTIAYDNGYLYVCIATNTWKRVAISSW